MRLEALFVLGDTMAKKVRIKLKDFKVDQPFLD